MAAPEDDAPATEALQGVTASGALGQPQVSVHIHPVGMLAALYVCNVPLALEVLDALLEDGLVHLELGLRRRATAGMRRGADLFRVVVCTDSLDVVDAICYRLYND